MSLNLQFTNLYPELQALILNKQQSQGACLPNWLNHRSGHVHKLIVLVEFLQGLSTGKSLPI